MGFFSKSKEVAGLVQKYQSWNVPKKFEAVYSYLRRLATCHDMIVNEVKNKDFDSPTIEVSIEDMKESVVIMEYGLKSLTSSSFAIEKAKALKAISSSSKTVVRAPRGTTAYVYLIAKIRPLFMEFATALGAIRMAVDKLEEMSNNCSGKGSRRCYADMDVALRFLVYIVSEVLKNQFAALKMKLGTLKF